MTENSLQVGDPVTITYPHDTYGNYDSGNNIKPDSPIWLQARPEGCYRLINVTGRRGVVVNVDAAGQPLVELPCGSRLRFSQTWVKLISPLQQLAEQA